MKKSLLTSIRFHLVMVALVALIGCGSASYDRENSTPGTSTYHTDKARASEKMSDELTLNEGSEIDASAPPSTTDGTKMPDGAPIKEKNTAKIIKTADINMQVEKYTEARKKVIEISAKFNAYIANENEQTDNYNISNTMIIRINCEKFDQLADELTSIAIYVNNKTINSEDITEQYIDAQARLKSKKEVEARYQELLKKANNVREILEVENYLRVVREEIEAYEGKLRYWNDRIAYSTITLHFYQKLDFVASPEKHGFWYKIGKGFKSGWRGLQILFIGIVTLWPLWLIIGFIVWLTLRLIRRSRKRK